MRNLSLRARLSLAQAATFATLGIYMPFWTLWLEARGYDDAAIGLLMAVPSLARNLMMPWIAHHADRSGKLNAICARLTIVALAAFLVLPLAPSFAPLLVLQVLFYGAFSSLLPLIESLALATGPEHGIPYGKIRLFGSAGFLVANLAGGALLTGRPASFVWFAVLAALFATLVAILLLPRRESSPVAAETAPRVASPDASPRSFLPLVLLALGYGAIQASHGAFYVCSTLHWTRLGFSASTAGSLWALGVLAEIAFFASGARILRGGVYRWLWIGGVVAMIRWWLHPQLGSVPGFVLLQLTHAITFGASHLAALMVLRAIAPEGRAATAQSVLYAITGMLGAGSMALAGHVFERSGVATFDHMALIAAAGTLGVLAFRSRILAAAPGSIG
jgi:PPP family 3-phenylpropionic acid transporter